MAMDDADTLDLLARFDVVVQKYVPLAARLAPEFEQFGKYKRELEAIIVELKSRGVAPEESEDLRELIEEELKKRGKPDNDKTPDPE